MQTKKSKRTISGDTLTEYKNPDSIGHIRREALAQVPTIDRKTFEAYSIAANKREPFLKRVKNFLLAESRSGRRAKIVKDFVLLFVPWGKQVSSASELLTEVFAKEPQQPKPNTKVMKITQWLKDRLAEPSTKSALVVLAAGGTFFGLSIDAVQLAGALDSLVTALSGVITAGTLLYEMFRKEKKDSEEV